jgi:hypothetical protein
MSACLTQFRRRLLVHPERARDLLERAARPDHRHGLRLELRRIRRSCFRHPKHPLECLGKPNASLTGKTGEFQTTGLDCSGLALYAIAAAGGPNLFGEAHGPSLENYGVAVSLSESAWQPGDVISFDNGQHFAIWAGNGEVIQADTAVSWSGGGWPDGVSEVALTHLTADLSITTVRRFAG